MISKALTIAGSDSGGGAGIQADLKTFQELGVFGMSAITAVTAQNTLGVQDISPLSPDMVESQLRSIGDDLRPDAVKLGMLFSSEIIRSVSKLISEYGWGRIVIDPVMMAKGGASLLKRDATAAMQNDLFPLAEVITPNIPETEALTGLKIVNMRERKEAAIRLHSRGAKYVLVKGGHEEGSRAAIDLLYDGSSFTTYTTPRIQTDQTHGTGCTFAAAIAAGLAQGMAVEDAVYRAKGFIHAAIASPLGIGSGKGPTNHWAYRRVAERGRADYASISEIEVRRG